MSQTGVIKAIVCLAEVTIGDGGISQHSFLNCLKTNEKYFTNGQIGLRLQYSKN